MTEPAASVRAVVAAARRHPDAIAAAATALAVVVLGALGLTRLWMSLPVAVEVPLAVRLLPALAGCLVMLGKRRAPFIALAAGFALAAVDLAFGGSLGMLLVVFDLLYSAVLHGRTEAVRALLGGIAASVVAAFIVPLAVGATLQVASLVALQVFFVLGTPYWWAMSVRRSRELVAVSEARAHDAERLAALQRDEAVREERGRMARDLHDVVAGNLSAIAISAEAALAGTPSPARDREALRAVRAASIAGLDEMRSMIVVLRSADGAADDAFVAPARLAGLDDLVARAPGVRVRIDGDPPTVPTAIDQAFARIVGEALVNAARHAPGADVVVAFGSSADAHAVTVTSTGGRAASARGTGHGIALMRERAERLGGELEAGPVDGGWRVTARMPRSAP